jgi:probable DNA repair protein
MYLDQMSATPGGTSLIARSNLAANHWEATLAAAALRRGDRAWSSPALTTFPRWLGERWERARRSGSAAHDRCQLSAGQAARLWQRIIEESSEGASLLSPARVASWAQQARRTLLDHGIQGDSALRAQDPGDSGAFLRWQRQFDRALDDAGWIDPESLLYRLNRLPLERTAGNVLLLDPDPAELPERRRWRENWRAMGLGVASLVPDIHDTSPRLVLAGDPEDELELAAEWALRLTVDDPRGRVAVVIADLDARSAEAEQVFADRFGAAGVTAPAGHPLGATGIVGAARNALELLSSRADFGTLSRWLRSPFFESADRDRQRQAVKLECRLRADVRSQQGFLIAYRAQGLRAELDRHLPDATARLDAVLDRLPRRANLSRWVELWQWALKTLGWRGITNGLDDRVGESWERTLASLAELTPVTEAVDLQGAIDELDRVVAGQRLAAPSRICGVHLLRRISEVGPGFTGVWVTGFSDQNWPEPPPANPLVPWSLQLELGMPAVRPGVVLAAAAEDLERLRRRVPELVLSCPERILDQPQVPHPRFSGWSTMARGAADRASVVPFAASRIGARARETHVDKAPPLEGRKIPGATRTLDLQSSCPLRAFVESRLGVRELAPVPRGIDGRLRGNLLHCILELLHRPPSAGAGEAMVDDSIAAAFGELLPQGDDSWQAQVELERRRTRRVLGAWLEAESLRTAFTTIAVEQRAAIDIDGWEINGRIDRVDRLASGEELLLDYKTGKRVGARWLGERLADCQLPLYAQRPGAAVAAIVLVALNDAGPSYRARGPRADAFPGSGAVVDVLEWRAELERWRSQLLALVEEFARGDTRIRGRGGDLEGTLWPALARSAQLRQ